MSSTRSVTQITMTGPRSEKKATRPPLRLNALVSPQENEATRRPPSFRPPDLPSPGLSVSTPDMLARLQNTPTQSPIASPFRMPPLKVIDGLLEDEATYLDELLTLQTIINEKLLGHELDCLAGPVERMIDLASEMRSKLSQKMNYFSDPQRECLLQFAKVATTVYQSYFESFRLGTSLGISQSSERIRLVKLLHGLDRVGEADRDLDWLLRRPLSRVRSYSTVYKKLLHSSDDATDLFLAYETFHSLLKDARDTLEAAREQQALIDDSARSLRTAQRSVSGGSTSTQSSLNSKISAKDELIGLQEWIDCSQCRDIFSLSNTIHVLDIVPKDHEQRRALVSRENFQLSLQDSSSNEAIDCLVELILLTDQLLITRPSFSGPRLMFPPLLRGVFHVSYIPSEMRLLELDIVGRQTLRLTAATPQARSHWYELLLACEDYKLNTMPAAPASLASHIGQNAWMPLAPLRLPPTPPHMMVTPTFGSCAPLRVIRENSQLSIAGYSDASGRTPDAHDHPPFQFDQEDEATPKALLQANPMEKALPALVESSSATEESTTREPDTVQQGMSVSASDENLPFPLPPLRPASLSGVRMTKSQSVDLFSPTSYTDQFLRAPTLGVRSKTMQPSPVQKQESLETALTEHDLDFTKDDSFDENLLDLPTLPAFDFGDGVRRPSSVALNFSPNTMSNFGIPMRKVPAPKPMVLPDVEPLSLSPQKSSQSGTLAQRRLGNELSLDTAAPPVPPKIHTSDREVFTTMAECFNWINGIWTPILLDDVDAEGKMKTVRSSRVMIYFEKIQNGFLEVFDMKDRRVINTFGVFTGTSIIRDDACDISAGFDIGSDKVYYMFRAETPEKANALQHALNQAKFAAPQTGFTTPVLPVTPLWPESDASAALVEALKIKLYLLTNGKWINKGSARLTIRMIAGTRNRRISLTGKTKKNERIMLLDYISGPGDCDALSKTSISVKTKTETYMMQFKGGEKERSKILSLLVV